MKTRNINIIIALMGILVLNVACRSEDLLPPVIGESHEEYNR